jgi:predicted ATP-dependent protease
MTTDTSFKFKVPVEDLRPLCEPSGIEFESSDQLPSGTRHLGQQRAIDAIRLGIQIESDGHNVFVLGPPGSHRHGLAEELAKEHAAKKKAPNDWCYITNFTNPEKPHTLSFPTGRGEIFRQDMSDLIDELRLSIPATFEGEDYRNQLKAVEAATQKEVEERWQDLEDHASSKGIGVLHTPTGYVLAPVKDEKVVDEEEFSKLPEAERVEIQEAIHILSEELQTHIEHMPQLQKKHRERVKALNREVTEHAVGVLLSDLRAQYEDLPAVVSYLDEVQQNIIENGEDFRSPDASSLPFLSRDTSRSFDQYEVNLVVSNKKDAAAPVIFEPNPNYTNIIGKVEYRAEMGALLTDFRMIRAGALLAANGGYLILDMQRILNRPFVWEALKQALFAKQVRIESPGETYGFVSTSTLQPDPIPLDIKVILVGERWLYYLLCVYDSEFNDLFKIAADLDDDLPRNDENVEAYLLLVADRIRERKLLPFSRDAMQKVMEQRARRAEDSERLSMHMRSLEDLLTLGEFRFGFPVRITATTRIGAGKVVDIEREVELGGAIHSKGVMILSAALSSRYASEVPLSLHGNVVFEQSYGGVDGDSASVAELCALLSSLSGVPIRQNLAVTGSINQLGRVQVIGGVNEKIEGYFDICSERGLDGSHGVIIPRDNIKHLMLREDVVEAVAQGQFSVFAVSDIDEALSILTGVEAGRRDENGEFPKDSVNRRVEMQLVRYAELRRNFAKKPSGDE